MEQSVESLTAHTILQGFDAQYGRFLEITAGAQQRFEQADWHGIQRAMKQRIHLYDHHVGLVVAQLHQIVGSRVEEPAFIGRVKAIYTTLLPEYPRYEIAESFFNSVYCRLFHHRAITPDTLFLFSSQPEGGTHTVARPLDRHLMPRKGLHALFQGLLGTLPLRLPWEDLMRDVSAIVQVLEKRIGRRTLADARIEVANELFYRNKAAWLVGKIRLGDRVLPLLLPIHHNGQGALFVDTCLTEPDEASIVFGFARAYFMVYAPHPAALVGWLREILPGKNLSELYMAIGCQKHGKTEYYREYLAFMAQHREQFIIAPGVKGMVMLVFTLPSFDRVFKVIKDRFAPQKEMSAARVRDCYQLVKEHDRVGRMADTQEYENFVIAKAAISPALLEELWREVPEKLEDLGDRLLIRHLYMERRMIPLNLYLAQADDAARRAAIEEYGNAIKQLAAANIFPGDMLFKNFGVTRHARVVFYDYDEICYMTEVNFRDIPPPRHPEEELGAEPWYSVAPNDVFPEEFRHFLCADRRNRTLFEELHADLFSAAYWRSLQQRIRQGYIEDVFAYPHCQRFSQQWEAIGQVARQAGTG